MPSTTPAVAEGNLGGRLPEVAMLRDALAQAEVDLELLAEGLGDAQAIEALVDAEWLCDTTPGQARFRHALLRETRPAAWMRCTGAYQRLADCYESDGRYATAREMFMTAAERCAANGQPMQREACRACALPVLVQNGDWALGLAVADEIATDPASPAWTHAFAPVVAGEVRALRGEFRIARVLLKSGLQALRQIGFRFVEPRALHALALCEWFDGETPRAVEHARHALKVWSDGEEVHHILPIARTLSTLFTWAADADGVASCVDAASVARHRTQPSDGGNACAAADDDASLPHARGGACAGGGVEVAGRVTGRRMTVNVSRMLLSITDQSEGGEKCLRLQTGQRWSRHQLERRLPARSCQINQKHLACPWRRTHPCPIGSR